MRSTPASASAWRVAVDGDEEQRRRRALEDRAERGVLELLPGQVEDGAVDELDGRRVHRQRVLGGGDRLDHRREVAHRDRPGARQRHQADRRLGGDGERALGADDEPGEVERRDRRRGGRDGSRPRDASSAETRWRWRRGGGRRCAAGRRGCAPPGCRWCCARRRCRRARRWLSTRRSAPRRARARGRWSCRTAPTRCRPSCCRSCRRAWPGCWWRCRDRTAGRAPRRRG